MAIIRIPWINQDWSTGETAEGRLSDEAGGCFSHRHDDVISTLNQRADQSGNLVCSDSTRHTNKQVAGSRLS